MSASLINDLTISLPSLFFTCCSDAGLNIANLSGQNKPSKSVVKPGYGSTGLDAEVVNLSRLELKINIIDGTSKMRTKMDKL